MFSENSIFLNIPIELNHKQAIFIDGMRSSGEILELSYSRLCNSLTHLASESQQPNQRSRYTHVFLDAWAFVDAVDRFRSLWGLQPNAKSIQGKFSPKSVNQALKSIRDIRNVSAHVAQKVDQIKSLNSPVSGSINWVTLCNQDPLLIKSFFIRPGIAKDTVTGQFSMPNGEVKFMSNSGNISLFAGKHKANLSDAYEFIVSVIRFSESAFQRSLRDANITGTLPLDIFGISELDV